MTFYAPPSNSAALALIARRALRRRKPLALAAVAMVGLVGYGGAQVVARALSPEIAPVRAKVAAARGPFEDVAAQPGAARLYVDPAQGWEIRSSAVAPDLQEPPEPRPLEALLRATRAARPSANAPRPAAPYAPTLSPARPQTNDPASQIAAPTRIEPPLHDHSHAPNPAQALSAIGESLDLVLSTDNPEQNAGYVRREIRVDSETPLRQTLLSNGVSEADADAAADALPATLRSGDLVEISLAPAAYRFDLKDAAEEGAQAVFAIGVTGADGSRSNMQWTMVSAFSASASAVEVVRLSPEEAAQRLAQIRQEAEQRARALDGPVLIRAEIGSNLYTTAQQAGLTNAQTGALVRIFQSLVDFQRDIRRGDSIVVLFDRDWEGDGSYEDGPIRYAALSNRGRVLELFRFLPAGGQPGYYDADGRSNKRSLLKTPIEGARISSRYGMRRHPVLGYNRMHKGMDFAARRGTPILAAGDGVVDRIGRRGAYGKYIRIRHNGSYSTAYAHLNGYRRGLSRGDRVRQGQVIGYVGTTGRSTGPHLHYEVLQNGRQVNPMRVSNFESERLEGAQARRFSALRDSVSSVIAALESPADERRVAQSD